MFDILDEAKQDYEDARNVNLFKKILPIVIGITLLVIILLILSNWYIDRQNNLMQQRSTILFNANFQKNLKNELIDQSISSLLNEKNSISELAALYQASNRISSGKLEEASIILEKLIQSAENIGIKNLAKISHIGLLLDKETLTKEENHKIQSYISSVNQTEPLYESILLYNAMFQIKNSNFSNAEDILNRLLDIEQLSFSVKDVATKLLNHVKRNSIK
ncbi:MAG: tetratricopeptide repeat protein [Rickettsiaceae bacterium]|nr:tetratricopeptide repeat protein [Rickettsiaceae bacterium]